MSGNEATTGEACPECGTARHADDLFCEVCGLDFATGKLPEAAPLESADPEKPGSEGAAAPTGPTGEPSGWSVTIEPDKDWFDHNEAESGRVVEYPEHVGARTVELVGDVMTLGRRDDKRGWFPDIDLGAPVLDPSTSRKHAEFRREGDGWTLVDLDSTNGTRLGSEKLTPNAPVALTDGSVVHVGAFTRLTVSAPDDGGGS